MNNKALEECVEEDPTPRRYIEKWDFKKSWNILDKRSWVDSYIIEIS